MNINQAKDYIKKSVCMYLKKDEYGDYKIPVMRQRPIFLVGAPGIGKTAIMEQIAQELGIALVSYSMTHHTRQSALGLPFISHKVYGGKEYDVSEYTMSEIIASIYETMEKSGMKEGILFLDEINCVSETLAPAMLQFLQYKVFGKHSVPEGFVIVTAGNPPEYNKSVREFDVATLDRLKVIEVEPDFETWKKYALDKGLHNSIVSFLELKKEYFYSIETTVKGRNYVTARGWEDLSDIIYMYEEDELDVEENLIGQYIRNSELVKEFASYYEIYNKYKYCYDTEKIFEGVLSEEMYDRAKKASFDERVTLISMIIEELVGKMKETLLFGNYLKNLAQDIRLLADDGNIYLGIKQAIAKREKNITSLSDANSLSTEEKIINRKVISFFKEVKNENRNNQEAEISFIKDRYNTELDTMKNSVADIKKMLKNVFDFVNTAFEEEREMLILVTGLAAGTVSSVFLATYGSEDYNKYSELLMISDRQSRMRENINKLELD